MAKIKQEILTTPIMIKHEKGETVQMLGIKSMVCPYCHKKFFRHWRDRIVGKQITCPHCGETSVNTSNKKFELKKVESNEKKKPTTKSNAKKSSTNRKSKTTKS